MTSTPIRYLGGLLLICLAGTGLAETTSGSSCVVLLHGMARTSKSMHDMAGAAAARGYLVVNTDYPSREQPIAELAALAVGGALERCRRGGAREVNFITHSLGGILVRYYLRYSSIPELGRVVMLSPPNGGSEAADGLADWAPYRWLNGPAGQQLITGPGGVPQRLGPVDFPLGVITGNRHAFFDNWLVEMFPGPNDGKVSVERAKVAGMHDFLVVPYAHPYIMDAPEVIEQALYFLRHGRFRRDSE